MHCFSHRSPAQPDFPRDPFDCDESTRVSRHGGAGPDAVVYLGAPTDIDCPGCGDQLVTAIIDGYACQACPSCFGVALDHSAFDTLVAERRARLPRESAAAAPLQDLNHLRDCPFCRDPMEVHPDHGPGNTIIDSCRTCRLIWLDVGDGVPGETAPLLSGNRVVARA
jgi:Zn-finger nucleic acid-binding protein